MKKRIDPYSGESFFPKRNNQRFASRRNQIAFNNRKAREQRDKMSAIDNQIKNNYLILQELLSKNKLVKKNKEYLLGKGYNFRFMNNLRKHEGKSYYGIYDCGIRAIDSNHYEIIKFEAA